MRPHLLGADWPSWEASVNTVTLHACVRNNDWPSLCTHRASLEKSSWPLMMGWPMLLGSLSQTWHRWKTCTCMRKVTHGRLLCICSARPHTRSPLRTHTRLAVHRPIRLCQSAGDKLFSALIRSPMSIKSPLKDGVYQATAKTIYNHFCLHLETPDWMGKQQHRLPGRFMKINEMCGVNYVRSQLWQWETCHFFNFPQMIH